MIVRAPARPSAGKIAAQCGHATLGAYKRSLKRRPEFVHAWEDRAQAKITLKVDSEDVMDRVAEAAEAAGLVTYIVVRGLPSVGVCG